MADTQKKKRSVYSFGLKKTDSPIIKEFIENQTNFSETVSYLIYKYVSEIILMIFLINLMSYFLIMLYL